MVVRTAIKNLGNRLASHIGAPPISDLTLSRFSLNQTASHLAMMKWSSATNQDVPGSIFDDRIPQPISLGARYAHLVSDVVVHPTSGLMFISGAVVDQSGQVYANALWHCRQLRISPPSVARLGCIQEENVILLPPIHAFYHWAIEWLPTIQGLVERGLEPTVVTATNQPAYVFQWLSELTIPYRIVKEKWVLLNRAWVLDKPPFGTLHQDDVATLRALTRRFRQKIDDDLPRSRGIYISRVGSSRGLTRERDLEEWVRHLGFSVVRGDSFAMMKDQIRAYSAVEIVVGPTGSGLANAVFMRPGSLVIDLFSPVWAQTDLITVCAGMQMNYRRIELTPTSDCAWGDAHEAIEHLTNHLGAHF